jgi:hypothetical protein
MNVNSDCSFPSTLVAHMALVLPAFVYLKNVILVVGEGLLYSHSLLFVIIEIHFQWQAVS